MGYPFSKAETVADGAVHAAGLAFAIPATALLVMNTDNTWAVLLYGLCMVGAFAASAIYHMSPIDRTRPLLHRLDHAAIYFKIAGTYTPLVAVIGSGFAYGILGIVWALALIGAVAKLWFWKTDARGSLALYLGMGWLSVLLIVPMWKNLPGTALSLVVAGGLIYSLGTIVYARKSMPFHNAIWHGFVLIASICFFGAIALSV
ncbi:hemolysin III [Sulfitobacter sp. SK012]|uniref:PAQR family membrane homeostasis protein TrhA n=1 Tax=Sulfitobacter sp. SK012 TaxID=1389005 RepID=UPI000E0CAE03|nr:hemolysin III family protein [Sulfitobacter sp. SK012]AXI47729.1 hemolysin III [Sulfitobacter sp. SK012]